MRFSESPVGTPWRFFGDFPFPGNSPFLEVSLQEIYCVLIQHKMVHVSAGDGGCNNGDTTKVAILVTNTHDSDWVGGIELVLPGLVSLNGEVTLTFESQLDNPHHTRDDPRRFPITNGILRDGDPLCPLGTRMYELIVTSSGNDDLCGAVSHDDL